ncbi:MAG: AI-2E family transporter [Alphaproteobacteria bacterium]|nr:AI-2E family transporter [Alphaproteobacteria bacterium]
MNGIIIFAGLIFLLWFGRSILIPLLIATFLWYLMNAISDYYRKVLPYRDASDTQHKIWHNVFNFISHIATLFTVGIIVYLFITQIKPMFSELVAMLPTLQTKLVDFGIYLSNSVGMNFDTKLLPNITDIASKIGASVATIATSMGMVFVYMIFMFVEQSTFHQKFSALFPSKRQSKKSRYILDSIDYNMKKYLFVKTTISAITGILSFIWLQLIGVEFAGVWAFIVFVTSYIPTIGAIIACSLPILYSLVTAPSLQQPLLTAVGLIALQIIFGNILEPKFTGKTLNLSTLAILINLVFWGMLWGVAGMFFSVPMLVAIFIICAQFDSTRPIAILLSADGNIPDKKEED